MVVLYPRAFTAKNAEHYLVSPRLSALGGESFWTAVKLFHY